MASDKKRKRANSEGRSTLLHHLADFPITKAGSPLSQDVVNIVLRLWARASLEGKKNAREWVCEAIGLSRRKMQELITEAYSKQKMAEKKKKKREWKKEPKIARDALNAVAVQIRQWNKTGTLATIPKVQRWLREEKKIDATERRIRHYLMKMGFEWGRTKRKGLLAESDRVLEWRGRYLSNAVQQQLDEVDPYQNIYLDESYCHQNHASNWSWFTSAEGNGVGTPVGKGQRLVMMGAGGKDGWVPNSIRTWVV
jgi:hypothetical protein